MALRFYGPIAVLYYSQVAGSYTLGMSIFSLATVSQALFEVPTGIFCDLIGRRKTIIAGAICSFLSVIGYAIGGTYLILAFGACLEGMARSFFSGNNDALLHDTLAETGTESAYMDALGRYSAMLLVGLGVAAVIGSTVGSISFQLAMWTSVLPIAIALIVSFFFLDSAHLGFGICPIAGRCRRRRRILLCRTHLRRFGELRLVVGGAALSELFNLIALLFPNRASPVLMSANSIFYGTNGVAMNGLMQREFSNEQRARMGSLTSFAGSILFSVVSVLFGALADQIGVMPALIVATLLSVIPMLITWRALTTPNK